MATGTLTHPRTATYDHDDPAERVMAGLVRDAHDAELRARLDASLRAQLEVIFEATGGLP